MLKLSGEIVKLKLGVVGCGQMGQGIAHVSALAGHQVLLYDSFEGVRAQALGAISAKLTKQQEQQKLTNAQCSQAIANLSIVDELEALNICDLVIEAIKEDYTIKQQLFKELSAINGKGILATNTSSLSVNKISQVVKNPERFIGLHFMNPVPVMPLVELISLESTNPDATNQSLEFCKSINKTVVQCKDQPGFIVNRILLPMINQAIHALDEGLATPEDIDTAMKLGANFPMGPLQLADFIGLDTCLAIIKTLQEDGENLTLAPSKLLIQKVSQGKLGKKTKEGFFIYE